MRCAVERFERLRLQPPGGFQGSCSVRPEREVPVARRSALSPPQGFSLRKKPAVTKRLQKISACLSPSVRQARPSPPTEARNTCSGRMARRVAEAHDPKHRERQRRRDGSAGRRLRGLHPNRGGGRYNPCAVGPILPDPSTPPVTTSPGGSGPREYQGAQTAQTGAYVNWPLSLSPGFLAACAERERERAQRCRAMID